ncbi:PREDICTED: venom protease-like isoform X2 [Nicrophorus vespilloides]|uniref:Venom protease-like isoform X2 n=1 Tax=Nicrophorus vespilloides TaxID=110193 RepID=A0ABM1MQC9_NICVS|nr:PREDICTED: venom protease-like isoform X2 [Nicrophorus vespilloides]
MFNYHQVIVFFLTIASNAYIETKDVKCENATKFCENIWYCKDDSYPDKYKACGHDGLVDRVCCDPKYKQTKSRKYCDTIHKRLTRDEYGNKEYGSTDSIPINTQSIAALGQRNESSTKWVCAGSLISNKFVLTAAKCVNQSINIIRLGDTYLENDNDGIEHQEYGVLRHIVHPKYKYPFVYNDIALIELNDTVRFTYFVLPLCISDGGLAYPFGEIGYNETSVVHIQVFGLNNRACDLYFEHDKFANLVPFGLDLDTQICASGSNYHNTCQASVGAPLQSTDLNYDYTNFLEGITVIPKPCSHTNEPGLYTRVSHYAPWIESIIFPDD